MAKNTRDEEFDRASYGGSAYDQQYFSDDELMATAAIRAAAEAGDTDWGIVTKATARSVVGAAPTTL